MNQSKKGFHFPPLLSRGAFNCVALIIALFIFSPQIAWAQYQKTQKAVTANIGSNIGGYYESLPTDYSSNPSKKYPLLIFLHGVGELGNGTTQISLVLKNAIPKLLNAGTFPASFTVGGEQFSFIVISPQFKSSSGIPDAIGALIDYCKQKYRVDDSRIYLTGLSMGGKTAWSFSAGTKARAEMVAAIVPVCSGAESKGEQIANVTNAHLPMWFLNNSGDPYISATKAQQLVNSINAIMTAPKAKITIHQQSGHDAWTKSYDPNFRESGMNVYEWMLSYKRGGSGSTPPPPTVLPKAVTGWDQTITLPTNSAVLDGSGSTYTTGSTFLWEKTDGPAGGTIVSAASLKTNVTGLTVGDHRFQLTITDKSGNVSTAATHIIVKSGAVLPKAVTGWDQTIMLPTNSAVLDGSKSTYPTGSTFLWRKTNGPSGGTIVSPTSLKTNVTDLTVGDHRFELKITDKSGNISTAATHIIVDAASKNSGQPPLHSDAGPDQTITLPVSSVKINGSANSTAPEGSKHIWKQSAGPVTANILYPWSIGTDVTGLTVAGVYKFDLVITGPTGEVATSTVAITVKSALSGRTMEISADNSSAEDQIALLPSPGLNISTSLEVKVYPNPVRNEMNLTIDGVAKGKTRILIYDLKGQLIFQQEFDKSASGQYNKVFDVSKLSSGTYVCRIIIDGKYSKSTRLLKL